MTIRIILVRTVDARGNTSFFGYNSKFQLIGSTNAMGNWVTNFYNSTDGTLSTRADAGGTTSYGYDSYGQLSIITYPGSLGSEGFLNNALGDMLSRTNARAFVTSLQYNPAPPTHQQRRAHQPHGEGRV